MWKINIDSISDKQDYVQCIIAHFSLPARVEKRITTLIAVAGEGLGKRKPFPDIQPKNKEQKSN